MYLCTRVFFNLYLTMSTFRELAYLVLDELKGFSDDFTYTPEHVIFLLSKYRAFLLKQRYSDIKKFIPYSNYQTICMDLVKSDSICGDYCDGDIYLKTTSKVPFFMQVGVPRIHSRDYYKGDIALISRDRMRYVGYNKYLKNIIYGSIAPDMYLYLYSKNHQFLHLEKVEITALFQDPVEAFKLQCSKNCTNGDVDCDILDSVFPMEDSLVPPLVDLVVKELSRALVKTSDEMNNSKDDVSSVDNNQNN